MGVAHVEEHRQTGLGHGPVHGDRFRQINGHLLEVGVDLEPLEPQGRNPLQLRLPALHGREQRAQADEVGMNPDLRGDKVVDMLDLVGRGGRAGDGAAVDPGRLLQGQQRLDRRQMGSVGAIKGADGGRSLLSQLVGENMNVDVCNRHGGSFFVLE